MAVEGGSPSDDLGREAVSGLGWQMAANVLRFGAQFAIGILLARLLPPEDFGIVGMAYIATGLVYVLTDLGFKESIVQLKEINEYHVYTCYTVSTSIGLALSAAMYATAGYAAEFFSDARLGPVLQVLSAATAFTGFATASNALLIRRLSFKTVVLIELLSSTVGYGLVALALALIGFGYWSLVLGTLVQAVSSALMFYSAVRHGLVPVVRLRELREMFGFSTKVSFAALANFVALKGDYFIIGRLFNSASLGYYTRSYTMMEMPHGIVGLALSRVLFPAASRVQHDPVRFRRAYLTAMSVSAMISVPVSLAMCILAPELVPFLFGDQWDASVPLLQVLCAFGMFRMMYNTGAAFTKAGGIAGRLLASTIVYAGLVVAGGWWAGTTFGLIGVAWAVGVAITAMWALIVSFTNVQAGVTAAQFGRALVRAAGPHLVVAAGAFGVAQGLRGLGGSDITVLGLVGLSLATLTVVIGFRQMRALESPAIDRVLGVYGVYRQRFMARFTTHG